ncbi:MAG: DUF4167 domain-containing protein [Alphaproteobacteria bacterium]|nr:DUF4167 domain-containing protein [Alphaproteobacteria bacterium]
MKRINGKFRSNGGNNSHASQVFSLNYRFDSNSIAGKINGTALDLIKKYNELAKDALNNSDFVNAELFRQYAEHYRKIVTDINDKKNAAKPYNNRRENNNDTATEAAVSETTEVTETEKAVEQSEAKKTAQRSFKVIEIKDENKNTVEAESSEEKPKVRRVYKKKVLTAEAV